MDFVSIKMRLPEAHEALPGRSEKMPVSVSHAVTGQPMQPPFPDHIHMAMFGMGCFWGVERKFWQLAGVFSSAVGYAAGLTPNPSYDEVCTGRTGHNEVVLVMFDSQQLSYVDLLKPNLNPCA